MECKLKDPTRLNNRTFAEKDKDFREACERMGVKPTPRQASKYRNRIRRWRNLDHV